jgi:hypothetical protein
MTSSFGDMLVRGCGAHGTLPLAPASEAADRLSVAAGRQLQSSSSRCAKGYNESGCVEGADSRDTPCSHARPFVGLDRPDACFGPTCLWAAANRSVQTGRVALRRRHRCLLASLQRRRREGRHARRFSCAARRVHRCSGALGERMLVQLGCQRVHERRHLRNRDIVSDGSIAACLSLPQRIHRRTLRVVSVRKHSLRSEFCLPERPVCMQSGIHGNRLHDTNHRL